MPLTFQWRLLRIALHFNRMKLTIRRIHIAILCAQINAQWPNEICGYLSGVGESVRAVYAVPNISEFPENSFVMEPQSQLNALVSVQNSKQDILALYHSHPAGARQDPSERDLSGHDNGYRLLMVIMPSKDREIESLRVFRIEEGRPVEVSLVIEPH